MHMLILHSKCSINVPTSCVQPGTCRNIWNVPNLLSAGKWQVLSTVIVMTFWYVLRNGLNFFKLFNSYFHLGLITTPMFSMIHITYVYSFSHVSFFTRSHGQEKSLSYYDLFTTSEFLLYRCIPTLIFFYFIYNPPTPILPVYIEQRRPHLEKDTTRMCVSSFL